MFNIYNIFYIIIYFFLDYKNDTDYRSYITINICKILYIFFKNFELNSGYVKISSIVPSICPFFCFSFISSIIVFIVLRDNLLCGIERSCISEHFFDLVVFKEGTLNCNLRY